MKKVLVSAVALSVLGTSAISAEAASVTSYGASSSLKVSQLARYDSNTKWGESGTEIVGYDAKTDRAFSINGALNALDILDGKQLKHKRFPLKKRILLKDLKVEGSDITSVAVHPKYNYIAVSIPAKNKTDNGHVVFLSKDGKFLSKVQVGALPDMVTFTPDGKYLLSANEGEPSDDYKVNPEGSISIITVNSKGKIAQKNAVTSYFNPKMISKYIRALGPTKADNFKNLEPEYITVDHRSKYAYVTIQERNAIAVYDIKKKKIIKVKSLGYKDYRKVKLDASDKDSKINMKNYPVFGIYQPDGIAQTTYKGKTYLLTANEGDTQDYEGYSEETRVGDIADKFDMNKYYMKGYDANILTDKKELARLKTSTSSPFMKNGKYNAVLTFGGRSFSVLEADTLKRVYDSGDDFETITAKAWPEQFNGDQEELGKISFDGRSDDKGPEPESVTTGKIGKHTYAFIGLERTGGIMVYNIDNPAKPTFETYFKSADGKDVSPEGLTFIPQHDSPVGKPLLLASHEMTGTIAVYEMTAVKK